MLMQSQTRSMNLKLKEDLMNVQNYLLVLEWLVDGFSSFKQVTPPPLHPLYY